MHIQRRFPETDAGIVRRDSKRVSFSLISEGIVTGLPLRVQPLFIRTSSRYWLFESVRSGNTRKPSRPFSSRTFTVARNCPDALSRNGTEIAVDPSIATPLRSTRPSSRW